MDFLSSIFDPQNYAGVTGLLDRMRPAMSFPTNPAPGFGAPPAAVPAQQGGVMDANAQLPQSATPTSGAAPLALAPAPAPDTSPGFLDGLRGKISDNSNMLLGLAAGIAGGKNWGDGISKGLTLAMQGGQLDSKTGNSTLTARALLAKGVDPQTMQAAVANPLLMKQLIETHFGNTALTTDQRNFTAAQNDPRFAAFLKSNKEQATKFGMNPVYGQTPDGRTVLGTVGNDGTFKQLDLPEGFTPQSGVEKIDMGTSWQLRDKKDGRIVGVVPKDLTGAEAQKAKGKIQGQVQAALPGDIATADQTVKQIDDLIKNPGLDSIVGPLDQFRGSVALGDQGRDALARYNQLKGRAFLQAYSTLRGGGQITEVEGAKAENAMARMDRAQSEADFRAALTDFRDAVKTGVQKLKEKAGVAAPTGTTSSGLSWSIE
jgi:hypothetical protein